MDISFVKPSIDTKWAPDCLEILRLHDVLEDLMFDQFMLLFGLDPENIDHIKDAPWEDIVYDWYDLSFELIGASGDVVLTLDQQQTCEKWGFHCCWICYKNGSEKYYSLKDRGH